MSTTTYRYEYDVYEEATENPKTIKSKVEEGTWRRVEEERVRSKMEENGVPFEEIQEIFCHLSVQPKDGVILTNSITDRLSAFNALSTKPPPPVIRSKPPPPITPQAVVDTNPNSNLNRNDGHYMPKSPTRRGTLSIGTVSRVKKPVEEARAVDTRRGETPRGEKEREMVLSGQQKGSGEQEITSLGGGEKEIIGEQDGASSLSVHTSISTENKSITSMSKYSKYDKMRVMRIPDGAIRQKMTADGVFTKVTPYFVYIDS
jgi:hypothetical protein